MSLENHKHLQFLLKILIPILISPPPAAPLTFDLSTLTPGSLKLLGDAHLKNGAIRLSRDLPVPNSGSGRALFSSPVNLRHPLTSAPISFSTSFSFSVLNLNPSSIGGGLAFILAADDTAIGDPGGFLGLINSTAASTVIAIEFDTVMDVAFDDINDNHIGLDLNSMISTQVFDLDLQKIDLKSGRVINCWIQYDNRGVLQVFVSYSSVHPLTPVLNFNVELAKFFEEFMFVGFSASTQGSTEIHIIESWNFSSFYSSSVLSVFPQISFHSPPPLISPTSPVSIKNQSFSSCHRNSLCQRGPIAGAVAGGAAAAAAIFLIAGAAFTIFARKKTNKNPTFTSDIIKSPREFTHRELLAATANFSPDRIIGHGAFGTVYKAIIPETGEIMAVKRRIDDSASPEFLSELSVIAALRHRNLVPLRGFCREKGEILLVYDHMKHGSLDKSLFASPPSPALTWHRRRKILAGVASALTYLHCECDRMVIHRDVKSSNVMLDVDYDPRLGDFGLARVVEHGGSVGPTVTAGTMGYIAPEYLVSGRVSDKTDVYSYGALVLEVVSGRRPIEDGRAGNLVDWVWGLYGEGRIMEAVDGKMEGGFEEREIGRVLMVGLGCLSPDPMARPEMRKVVEMIWGEAEPPNVPAVKPLVGFSCNQDLMMCLEDSLSDYNGISGVNYSTESSLEMESLVRIPGGENTGG